MAFETLQRQDLWEPGVRWNDEGCQHEHEWFCEDSEDLLLKAGINKPIVFG